MKEGIHPGSVASPSGAAEQASGASTCTVDVFPSKAIEYLNSFAEAQAAEAEAAGVVQLDASPTVRSDIRRSRVLWLPQNREHAPIYQLVFDIVNRLNAQVFGLELLGVDEPFQVATYTAEEEGFYGWHVDIGPGRLAHRKLSLVVPLSDPKSYSGGEFEVFYDEAPKQIEMPLGRVLLFPSYLLHRVRPVTRGVRRSLVLWIAGPPFR